MTPEKFDLLHTAWATLRARVKALADLGTPASPEMLRDLAAFVEQESAAVDDALST